MKSIIIFIIGLTFINCTLKIVNSPKSIENNLKIINYTLANFGDIPYGKRKLGDLVLADPLEACEKLAVPTNDARSYRGSFVLIQRGNCTFTVKAENALILGASLAIIYDNQEEDSSFITMGDDGFGTRVSIPAVFINKTSGELLQKLATELQTFGKGDQRLQLIVDFKTKKTDIVAVTFYLNIEDRANNILLREFRDLYTYVKDQIQINVVYRFFKYQDGFDDQKNCIAQQFCAIDPDGAGESDAATGQDVALQQFRQLCILKIYGTDKWLEYITQIDLDTPSFQYVNYEKGNKFMESLGIKLDAINKCTEGWENTGNKSLPELDKQIEQRQISGIIAWPGIKINSEIFKGNANGTNLIEDICSTLFNPSNDCQNLLRLYEPNYSVDEDDNDKVQVSPGESKSVGGIVTTVIVILIFLFLIIFYFYRRQVNKEIQIEINNQVQTQVSQYIAFYETKDGKHNPSKENENL